MDEMMLSTDATRIQYDADLYHEKENATLKGKYSLSDASLDGIDNITNFPFFARRGSTAIGPTTLRFVLRSTAPKCISDPQHSPTPHSPEPYEPIPSTQQQQQQQQYHVLDDNEYYQHSETATDEFEEEAVKLRNRERGRRKSIEYEYEYKLENDWKTSWKGILLIGLIWMACYHNFYSFCCLSLNLMNSFHFLIFDIGLMYFLILFGISIGIFLSSIILNQASMIQSSQLMATYSIFVTFLSQSIASIVFYYLYYYKYDSITTFCWYILLTSRFLLGLSIGFIETAIDNLMFEWFVIVNEMYFISRARPYTLLLKAFGHCSARLILLPFVYITFTNYKNLFFSLLIGVILSAVSWLAMIFAAIIDSKLINSAQKVYTVNKNKWMLSAISLDILSYKRWHEMGYIGFNKSVLLSIIYLSLNFAISFTFIILSITSFVQQYGYTEYTANLLLCCIPIINVTCNGLIRNYLLSPLRSEWIVAFMATISFSITFSLLAWLNISGLSSTSIWLPIICVLLFVFGYECFTAAGYELLLTATKSDYHGLVSGLNSTANYMLSSIFIIVFSILYQWAYSFLAFASYFNIIIIILLKLYHSRV